MREMKNSGIKWVGEIPSNWKVDKVKHIFMPRSSKGNDTLILLSATQNRGMCPQSELEGVVKVAENTNLQNFKTVHINDFVISLRSFQGGFEISEYEGVCSPAYQVFYNTANIYHKYYKTLFKSRSFVEHINSLTVGIREGKNIQYESFSYTLLPVPPLSEQKTIADFLDKKCGEIDELVGIEEQAIAELQAYKQAIITEAVTRGLNHKGENVPRGWRKTRIGKVSDYINGRAFKPSEWTNEGLPIVRIQNLTNINAPFNYTPIIHELKYQLQDGDLLFAWSASIDAFIWNRGKAWLNQHIFRVEPYPFMDKMFFYYVLKSIIQDVYNEAHGTGMVHVTKDHFENISIKIPPLPEQQAIAEYLDKRCEEIDSLIIVKQQKIAELKEYKKSVIYEYVTGKKEII